MPISKRTLKPPLFHCQFVMIVGVMGDERTYDYAIVLRAVTTRIVNEVKGVNCVLYDCTGKHQQQ